MREGTKKDILEVWGYNTYRPFRIYWILHEYNLRFKSYKIGSRTGETQTSTYLKINSKGKIPTLRHNENFITESGAAVNYIAYQFEKPRVYLYQHLYQIFFHLQNIPYTQF